MIRLVHRRSRRNRRAASLVEVSLSALLTGVLLLAALQAVGQSLHSQRLTAQRAQGRALAEGLLAEIVTCAYREPDGAATLGLDASEASPRQSFDDVDDFSGLDESPPQSRSGVALTGHAGWRRQVQVDWVDTATASLVAASETGVKRITVTASLNHVEMGRAVGLRCDTP